MKNMPKLFDIELTHPDEVKATNFISKLHDVDFVGVNMVYLTNYIDAEIGIALGHIKESYKRYVLNGGWTEDKFRDIVYIIARDRQMLIPNVFLRYGARYDDGELTREVNLERVKYENAAANLKQKEDEENEKEVSDEEQELLDYIAQHGGGQ